MKRMVKKILRVVQQPLWLLLPIIILSASALSNNYGVIVSALWTHAKESISGNPISFELSRWSWHARRVILKDTGEILTNNSWLSNGIIIDEYILIDNQVGTREKELDTNLGIVGIGRGIFLVSGETVHVVRWLYYGSDDDGDGLWDYQNGIVNIPADHSGYSQVNDGILDALRSEFSDSDLLGTLESIVSRFMSSNQARNDHRFYHPFKFRLLLDITALVIVLSSLVTIYSFPSWLRHRKRIKRGLCLKCGYSLDGITDGVCPECGNVLA